MVFFAPYYESFNKEPLLAVDDCSQLQSPEVEVLEHFHL